MEVGTSASQTYLARLLEGHDGRRLESEISLEVLCDFSDQSLEGELSDEELGGSGHSVSADGSIKYVQRVRTSGIVGFLGERLFRACTCGAS